MPSFGRSTTLFGGGGGGGGIGGSGTAGRLAKFTAGTTLGDSIISDDGTDVTINTGRLVINRGTITALSPALDVTTTWNNAAVTFTGMRYNVTDTASSATSRLADFMVGGVSVMAFSKIGAIVTDNGSSSFLFGLLANAGGTGVFSASGGLRITGGSNGAWGSTQLAVRSDASIAWSSTTNATNTPDVVLVRDAANTLAQRNGVNPQTFNIYNTFTSTTNHERGFLSWVSNEFRIGTEKGSGGGTARALVFQTDGTTRLTIGATGTSTFGGLVVCPQTSAFQIQNRAQIGASAVSVIILTSNTGADFDRLQFGGTTSSFPALKRSSATLQARLADDSAFTRFEALEYYVNGSKLNNGSTDRYIGAAEMIPRVTNGPSVNSSETATNDSNYDTLDFDTATSEGANIMFTLPNNWNNGTITAEFHWTADSGSGDVTWTIAGRALSNDDALDTAFGTAQSVTDTLIAAGDMHITSATSAVTIAGTPAAGTPVQFLVTRDIADTLGVDARLIGVRVIYTANI